MSNQSNFMKNLSKGKLAPIGLWVAGAGFLAFLLILVVKLLAYIQIYSITNAKPLNLWMWISLGVGVIGLAAFALLDPRRVRDMLSGRQARHGSNAVVMLLAFALILIVINALVYQYPLQKDWTESQTNSLAPETVKAIKAAPAPVHAIGFFTSNYPKTDAQKLLENIKSNSNGKFTYEFLDPNSNPALAQQYKISQDGTIVLTMSGHQELFTSSSEQDFTNSLVKLMNPGVRTVYFLTGHGEHSSETAADKSYTRARTVLESKNYTVKTLNLLAQGAVPEDALAVIIAGPTQPVSDQEINLLKNYVTKGGSLLVLVDPDLTQTGASTPKADPLRDYLATSWGIKVENDLVVDPSTSQAVVAVENVYGSHAITDSLNSQNLVCFFPTASSLTISSGNSEVEATALVKTVDRSWGETDFAALQSKQVSYQAGKDIPGPLTVAAAADNPNGKGKVVVFGDSDFASDAYFDQYGNSDMFINSVDWAAGQQAMISLTTKPAITRQMKPLTNVTVLLLAFAFVILIPGAILAAGITSWVMKRRRG